MTRESRRTMQNLAAGYGQPAVPRVMARLVASTVNYVCGQGATMEAITEATGIRRTDLLDGESRLPEDVIPRLWALVEPRQKELSPGLHMASTTPTSTMGPCEHLLRFAPTLQEGLQAIIRFGATVTDSIELNLLQDQSPAGIQLWHPLDIVDGGNAAEFGVAMLFRLITESIGAESLVSVDFMHTPLGSHAGYEKFFGVPIRFRQSRNAIFIRRAALRQTPESADQHLFDYVLADLELLQDRWLVPGERILLSQIYEAVRRNSEKGVFSADELAASMQVSLRKLQRETQKHGLTVSGILDETREGVAKRLLADRSLGMEQIAAALGYADSRAFRRAFQRWTGQTPAQYRNGIF